MTTNMDSRIAGSMNDNINMDSRIAGSMNDNINMDSRMLTTAAANNIESVDLRTLLYGKYNLQVNIRISTN